MSQSGEYTVRTLEQFTHFCDVKPLQFLFFNPLWFIIIKHCRITNYLMNPITVLLIAALKLTCMKEMFENETTLVFFAAVFNGANKHRSATTLCLQTQPITGDGPDQDGDLSAELDAPSHSSRSFDPVFKDAKHGTTRRSSPGGMQVSSSAAPQTQVRVIRDFTVGNCLFICVSMSEIRNKKQLFTVSESFQYIPSLHRSTSVRKSLLWLLPVPALFPLHTERFRRLLTGHRSPQSEL